VRAAVGVGGSSQDRRLRTTASEERTKAGPREWVRANIYIYIIRIPYTSIYIHIYIYIYIYIIYIYIIYPGGTLLQKIF